MTSDRQGHITTCVIWRVTPPTPAQLAAWRQLWARLLGPVDHPPEMSEAPGATTPEASKNCEPDFVDQAVGKPPCNIP